MIESRHVLLPLADGRTLDTFVSGPATGPVLLYHQGSPGNPIRGMIALAHRLGLRFVTTWRPGYGESTRLPGRSVVDVVPDSAAVLDFLGVERCIVLGWSGGGPHALACGARLAQRVAAISVIASVGPYGVEGLDWTEGWDQNELQLALQGEAAYRPAFAPVRVAFLEATPADVVAHFGATAADRAVLTEAVCEDLHASFSESMRLGVDGWLDDELCWVKPWGFDVSEIYAPTSLWQGTEDAHLTALSRGEWLAAHIPGVVAHIEPGDGHISICLGHLDQILQELVALSSGRL